MTTTRRHFVIGTIASAGLLACGNAHADTENPMLTIEGELSYRQRIALPPESIAHVEVRSASGALIAETSIELAGRQVPVPFTLDLARAHLPAGETYALVGTITVGPLVRWQSDAIPVDPAAAAIDTGVVWMAPREEAATDALSELQSGTWSIAEIAGKPVAADTRVTISFAPDGSFSGRACNGFGGVYRINGRSIAFGRAMSTMMACAEPEMAQEMALFDALTRIAAYDVSQDGTATLTGADGSSLIVARR